MTSLRVGIDFELAGTDKVPLDQKELKERIGEDAVMDDPETMQQRLAAALYGIEDVRRYEDLLHLLRTLRNPDVGVKAVEGQLEEYLSMALPPLDHEMVKRLAVQFQDLESIRENMRRLNEADEALARFLIPYRQYADGFSANALICFRSAQSPLPSTGRPCKLAGRRSPRSAGRAMRHTSPEGTKGPDRGTAGQVNELAPSPSTAISTPGAGRGRSARMAASALGQAAARRAEETAATAMQSAIHSPFAARAGRERGRRAAQEHFGRAGLDPALLPDAACRPRFAAKDSRPRSGRHLAR